MIKNPNYQAKTSKKQFALFIKTHKLKTYKRTLLGIPTRDLDSNTKEISVKIILNSGKEIPTTLNLVKQGNRWLVDQFDINPNQGKNDMT